MAPYLSDSKVQSDIELQMCSALENLHPDWHQVDWNDLSVGLEFAAKVKPDAVWCDENGRIPISECYARIGKLKPGHRRKIALDILKLISLREEFSKIDPPRLLLVVPDELGLQLEGNDWLSLVVSKQTQLTKVSLSDEQCQRLREAVRHQGEGQARRRIERVTDDPR